ncbi:MAG: hypothetical protein GX576_16270 [Thauera phenolivorans]|uniref:Uncharacterized protein n=1 Tax=Thauera phenolivorans TaxID=1792543 RepID=A0A7X7LYX2_9RHOO|nr:hypothetical protein [Thauera phenolivorans]NLF55922.1 hypothetical protein [Thauera phenolivorans]
MRIEKLAPALAAALVFAAPAVVLAETAAPAPQATPTAAAQSRPTDAVVREGMEEIRAALDAKLGADGARSADALDAAAQAELGKLVAGRVGRILKETTLPDKARKPLQVLFSDIIDGTELMQISPRPEIRRLAVVKVVQDVNRYGRQFDHPGWQPLAE